MRRVLLLAALLICAGGAFTAAQAQKVAPRVTRDADHDGVPDIRDRCPATAAGTRVDATGCPTPQAAAPAAPAPAAPAPVAQATPAPQLTPTPTAAPVRAPTGAAPAAPAAVLPSPSVPAAQAAAPPKSGPRPSGLPTLGIPVVTPGPAVVIQSMPPGGAAPSGPPANPPTGRPANAPPTAGTPAPVATPPSAPPAAPAPAPAAVAPAMTAGFSVPSYTGRTAAARLDYGRMLALRLDSALVALVEVFRGTIGRPLPGATSPDVLSAREKRRWAQCRLIHLDLGTMSDAVQELQDSMPGGAALSRAAVNLADAFTTLVATAECDNVGSMIDAPNRWAPWQSNYESSVGNFFRDWYTQLRAVHEADRAFARALNPALPAGRQFPVPSGLPPTAPTIGAVR
jgi:hypothetical protein